MAWLRGKVSLGSFPDLAGAVNKISESVKNIEKNFDNALGLEDQPASHSWSPEFMAFAQEDGNAISLGKHESSSHGNVTADSSKKLESSEKPESSEKHESSKEFESSEKHEPSKELESSERHESSTQSSFSKEKEGVDVDDSTNITEDHLSHVKEASAELPKPEEHHELSKENKGVDDGDTKSMEEHSLPVRESRIETIKPEEHQSHPVEMNIEVPEEVDNSAVKSMDTNTIIGEQAESIVGLPEESQKNTRKPIDNDTETSHEATAIVAEADSQAKPSSNDVDESESLDHAQHRENTEIGSMKVAGPIEDESTKFVDQVATTSPKLNEVYTAPDLQKSDHEVNIQEDSVVEGVDATYDGQSAMESKPHQPQSPASQVIKNVQEGQPRLLPGSDDVSKDDNENSEVHRADQLAGDDQRYEKEQRANSMVEMEMLKKEMRKMEAVLLGAARQAQAKADEISKLMNENEQLKSIIEDQRRKSNEAEMDSLREEYHQRVATLERKVYALTRERDTLRREQNKRNDATALLKEKDEIITQVMAEGEELSKKQAVQESTIRRLRAQIREFEEEKKGLISKLQVEENKVENLKNEKAATEKVLQETIEKNQSELSTQKEYYINALNVAKEAKAQAEAQANDEARTELESRLKESGERESMLVQTLNELRQTLIRKEQQQVYREDTLRKEINDLQKRYQASERRCEELVMQVPESTRPLLRQIEAMQDTTARKAEAWAAVERSLNIRLQDAEARAASAEEKDRAVNERLSHSLSRLNVLEAQISCLRSKQTQLSRSLEKERQKASESRQEYLAIKEEADTHKGHVNQLQEEMKELKRKHKRELQEALTQRELLQQDIEREKAARLELEKTPRLTQGSLAKTKSIPENGLTRRLSSANSISSMEESFFLQATLDPSNTFSESSPRVPIITPYYYKSMTTPNAFQAALRQKEGEIQSYMSRLASMESIRDSLTEELVKMTKECEKLKSEVTLLPSIKAELEALRIRHSAALELMGERDEELEELRADIVDVKEMYREQVNMLVNKIQKGSSIVFA